MVIVTALSMTSSQTCEVARSTAFHRHRRDGELHFGTLPRISPRPDRESVAICLRGHTDRCGSIARNGEPETYFAVSLGRGGPAGAALVNSFLHNEGRSIALVDRESFPRDKVSGDGLGPGVVDVIERLELRRVFDGYRPIEMLTVSAPSGTTVSGRLPRVGNRIPEGFVIPWSVFDDRLFKSAIAAGARDYSGWALKHATFDADRDRWRLVVRDVWATRESDWS